MENTLTAGTWHLAEKFNHVNLPEFEALLAAGRLAHIGFCLPSGVIGNFDTAESAMAWLVSGKNVYADVLQIAEVGGADAKFLLDCADGRGALEVDVTEWIGENRDALSDQEINQILSLRAGEAMNVGGGASPLFTIHRVADLG